MGAATGATEVAKKAPLDGYEGPKTSGHDKVRQQ